MKEDAMQKYERYMLSVQEVYDQQIANFPFQGYEVEGAIDGKGMINWKAPLSIMQMLDGNLTFDSTELKLLNAFQDAGLYEQIIDETYEDYEEIRDSNGGVHQKPIPKTKKVIKHSSIDDYITWCNNNFIHIKMYKQYKNIPYDQNQTAFTDEEVERIKLLYYSNSFFDLFSQEFRNRYSYFNVSISDEDLQKIYDEFLQNVGKRYVMDHSNLSYDTCMEYYDCSSWVIHCLAHTGIKVIPNTGADGIYNNYCIPITVDDRQPGDLIFLKNTYEVNNPQGISHIGIYMGELELNGETTEWVIDTGGNPDGVRIRKYNDGWWNGPNFFGFGRLK